MIKTENKKMFSSNSLVIKKAIQKHILEFYTVKELKKQVDYMKYNNNIDYKDIDVMVAGGCFLIYHKEIGDFINSLNIKKAKNKVFDNIDIWNLYKHLISRFGSQLIKE